MRARDAGYLLDVPYRSQLDGTPWERANCGPATLAMIMDAYGVRVTTSDLRYIVNTLQGTWGYDDGTGWEALNSIARDYGLTILDLFTAGDYYRRWTLDKVREHVLSGHPVMILANYRYLPGNGGTGYYGDHYIVITGLAGERFIYNDSAFYGDTGYSLIMDPEVLLQAWRNSILPMTAMAVGGKSGRPFLPTLLNKAKDRAEFFGRGSTGPGASGRGDAATAVQSARVSSSSVSGVAPEPTKAATSGVLLRKRIPIGQTDDETLDASPLREDQLLSEEQMQKLAARLEADAMDADQRESGPYRELPVVLGVALLAIQAAPKRFWEYL